MKTTVELPGSLVKEAKRLAAKQGTTLRDVIERALRDLLEHRHGVPEFKLRDASVGGKGLSVRYRDASWEAIREATYEGRGE